MASKAESAFLRVQGRSEDELLADLGRALRLEEGLGAFASVDELRRAAVVWLVERQAEFGAVLCPHPLVQSLCRKGDGGDRELFIAVFDLLAGLFVTDVPAPLGTLTALLLRRGLVALCGPGWPPAESGVPATPSKTAR